MLPERDTGVRLTGRMWCALHADTAPVLNMAQASVGRKIFLVFVYRDRRRVNESSIVYGISRIIPPRLHRRSCQRFTMPPSRDSIAPSGDLAEQEVEHAALGRIGHQRYPFAFGDLRLFLYHFERPVEPAQLVDQPVGFGLRAQPDPSLRERLNGVKLTPPRRRHLGNETSVVLLDIGTQLLAPVRRKGLVVGIDGRRTARGRAGPW